MLKRYYQWVMLVLLFVIAAVYLTRPLFDPDFYWHLKTGQWIWEHHALPVTDPFGVPPLPTLPWYSEFTLSSYWLFQLILYAFYSLGGMTGIIILRWILAGTALLICFRWSNIRNGYVAAVLALGSIELFEYYFLERPQFISFICFGLLLFILFTFVEQKKAWNNYKLVLSLSVLMLVWANMHGGFILGQVILILFLICEGLKFLSPALSPLTKRNYQLLFISSLFALAVSFINPNPINSLKMVAALAGNNIPAPIQNREYLSLLDYLKLGYDYTAAFYLLTMLLTACALLTSKNRKNITWIAVFILTCFIGVQHIRHTPFFLVAATLFMMRYFQEEYESLYGKIVLVVLLICVAPYSIRDEIPRIQEVFHGGWVPSSVYPVKAADFLAATGKSDENIYSPDHWGSYLIWRLGPDKKIFRDGRNLYPARVWEFKNSYWDNWDYYNANPQQRPYWKGLFNQYHINAVLLPLREENGQTNKLTESMYHDKDWSIIYVDDFAVVFRRNLP